ncbi:MAG TPA: CoA-binding protein [Flavisolibacter sp.]|nr:CoA-binding protein [Flavisolibacter sp.]
MHFVILQIELDSMAKKTIVLGASSNPGRYSYLAVQKLRAHQHPVIAIGKRTGKVADVEINKDQLPEKDVDTVTLYLNPQNQEEYYNYILSLHPRRIIFNPGTENDILIKKAKENNIEPVLGCTLVMLSTGQY